MNNSSLLELIGTFSGRELNEFNEFISSPFFNKNEGVIKLFEYIRKFHPDFEGEKFHKQKVFSEIFPNANYNDGFMRTLMFNLNKLAEEYTRYSRFKEDDFGGEKYLLESFRDRGLFNHFEKKFKEVRNRVRKDSFQDIRHFYNEYELEKMLNSFHIMKPGVYLNEKDVRAKEIQDETEYLIIYFTLSLMNRYRNVLNETYAYKLNASLNFLHETISFLEKNPYDNIPLVRFYRTMIKLMQSNIPDRNDFAFAKDFLLKNYTHFSRNEAYTLFINLINVVSVSADMNNMKECFDIWKFMLDKNIYYPRDKDLIDSGDFSNIVVISTHLHELDWLKKFIDKFKNKIEDEERESTANYAYAQLYYFTKDFEKSLKHLGKVQPTSIFAKMRIKTLSVRVYYELGWYQEALDQLDSFRHFIATNSLLTEEYVVRNENFIKFARRLIKIKSGSGKSDITALKLEVEKTDPINAKNWFVRKINELENEKA